VGRGSSAPGTRDRLYVVVSGPPGSGKSTLAPALAGALGLPLLAKDTIKEVLLASWPALDVDGSRRTGRAAMDVVFALAAASPCGAVLEANFHRSMAVGSIGALPGRSVEVFCRCRREVALQRYRDRAAGRHEGHFDAQRTDADIWHDEVIEPVGGGWPVVEVDTNAPVDVEDVVARVGASAERATA
jgi:energy-coupling factor transporter ATP-binding protein EcfA2